MSAFRLIGLTCAAAVLRDRDALAAAFSGLDAREAETLGAACAVSLERHAHATGDWGPWAEIGWYARLPVLHDAAAGFRARLDAAASAQSEWSRKSRLADEQTLRRIVSPLMRRGALKAEIEERAGRFADSLGWSRVFAILVEELTISRRFAGLR